MKIIFFIASLILAQTHAASKYYTGENRAYRFGFNIEGNQHRKESKDENGIIMGEFGFITADGVYHVTVYATDENGNFKIVSMKNIKLGAVSTGTPSVFNMAGKNVMIIRPTTVTTTPQPFVVISSTTSNRMSKQLDEFTTPKPSDTASCSNCKIPEPPKPPSPPAVYKENQANVNQAFNPTLNKPSYPSTVHSPNLLSRLQINDPQITSNENNPTSPPPSSTGDINAPTLTLGNDSPQYTADNTDSPPIDNSIPQTNINNVPSRVNISPQEIYNNLPHTDSVIDSPQTINNPPQTFPDSEQPVTINNSPDTPITPNTRTPKKLSPLTSSTGSDSTNPTQRNFASDAQLAAMAQMLHGLLYNFNYTVGYHGHQERGDQDGNKEGEYFVINRDGFKRTVNYKANEFGYQPHIKLEAVRPEEVPREETEKEAGLKGYEFKWFYLKK